MQNEAPKTTRKVLEAIALEVHENGWKTIECDADTQERLRARFYHARRMRRNIGFEDWDDINIVSCDNGIRFELNSLTTLLRSTDEGPKAA